MQVVYFKVKIKVPEEKGRIVDLTDYAPVSS